MKLIITLFIIFFSSSTFSQIDLTLIQSRFYVHEKPSKFERILEKYKFDKKALFALAEIYRERGDYKKSEEYFDELLKNDIQDLRSIVFFDYALLLKSLGKYHEANLNFKIVLDKNKNELRAKAHLNHLDFQFKLQKRNAIIDIKPVKFNTSNQEFAANYYKEEMVYSTKNKRVFQLKSEMAKPHFKLSNKVNKKSSIGNFCFTNNFETMYLTRVKKTKHHRYTLTIEELKKDKNDEWITIRELPFCNEEFNFGHPTISEDGHWLYFVSDKPGGYGGSDIYKTRINSDSSFGRAFNLGKEINTRGNEITPNIYEHTLFFASDGLVGLGGFDVFEVNLKKPHNKAKNLGAPINSQSDDFGTAIRNNQQGNIEGYFITNRNGNDDIYRWSIIPQTLELRGVVVDEFSGQALHKTHIVMTNKSNRKVETHTTAKGTFVLPLERNNEYTVEIKNDNKTVKTKVFNTHKIALHQAKIDHFFEIELKPK